MSKKMGQARGRLRQNRNRLKKKLATYSAATGAVAASAGGLVSARDANAAVVYSGEVNIPIPSGTTGSLSINFEMVANTGPTNTDYRVASTNTLSYHMPIPGTATVDLDGVGGPDATFRRNRLNINAARYLYPNGDILNIPGTFDVLKMGAAGGNGWITTTTSNGQPTDPVGTFVAKLNTGDPVGPGQTFKQAAASSDMGSAGHFAPSSNGAALGTYSDHDGAWQGGTGFVGLIFQHNDNTHYGWIRVRVLDPVTLDAVIVDYAYNDTPDLQIGAGATGVPLPNGAALGLVALGALGIRAYRQRREAA